MFMQSMPLVALFETGVMAGFKARLLTAAVLARVKAGFETLTAAEIVATEVTATVAPALGLTAETAFAPVAATAFATLAAKRLALRVVKALLGLQTRDHLGREGLLGVELGVADLAAVTDFCKRA